MNGYIEDTIVLEKLLQQFHNCNYNTTIKSKQDATNNTKSHLTKTALELSIYCCFLVSY